MEASCAQDDFIAKNKFCSDAVTVSNKMWQFRKMLQNFNIGPCQSDCSLFVFPNEDSSSFSIPPGRAFPYLQGLQRRVIFSQCDKTSLSLYLCLSLSSHEHSLFIWRWFCFMRILLVLDPIQAGFPFRCWFFKVDVFFLCFQMRVLLVLVFLRAGLSVLAESST